MVTMHRPEHSGIGQDGGEAGGAGRLNDEAQGGQRPPPSPG